MIDNDERLLQQFFSEAAHQKIEDNGFTERVMLRIEAERQSSAARLHTFSRLWTIFCVSVSFVSLNFFLFMKISIIRFRDNLRLL